VRDIGGDEFEPLFDGKEAILLTIGEDSDDYLIKLLAGTLDDVEVTISNGIE
jgi:hypothetical protein